LCAQPKFVGQQEKIKMKDAHNKAAEHHESAAKSHRAAAESHGKNDHTKGKEHATQAQQHAQNSSPRRRMRKAPSKSRDFHREAVAIRQLPGALYSPQQERAAITDTA